MEYPKELNQQPLQILVLNVTDACNCCCRYCFTHPNPTKMSLSIGMRAVDWFLEYNYNKSLQQKERLTVSFFGGEPTLCWDTFVVPIVQYTKEQISTKYNDVFDIWFSCTSNGQLLDEKKIKWFVENGGGFLLSMDGDRETQEYNRPRHDGQSSFDPLEKTIDILLKYQPTITFRSTIIPETVGNLAHDYLFARSRGFQSWFGMPNVRQNWSDKDLQILREQMTIISGIMLRDITYEQTPVDFSYIKQTIKAILRKDKYQHSCMRCGLGTTSIGVATDGSLYACQENSTYHDETNPFYIGDVYQGIDKSRHLSLLAKYNKPWNGFENKNCDKCVIKDTCGDWQCPSVNFDITGSLMMRPEPLCEWLKIIYGVSFNMIANVNQTNFDKFLKWITEEEVS